ncbi:MAG TPA: serine hydrolase domain-containing protein [Acidimicrobiales bacterium]|nr:serine hydrolase domain-containing protein [Acidimicrobiales bacterium]
MSENAERYTKISDRFTQLADDLASNLDDWTSELGIPGAAVAVVRGDEVTTTCTGVTSLEHPLPITDTTIFQIGSISKTFCATAAMVLVDRGDLDLDAPVASYVPDLRLSDQELTGALTTRHLLTHTAGWVGDYFGDTGLGDDALSRFVGKLAKAPQLTPLGQTFSYNNSAHNLASHVVARVNGSTFERAMSDLVLRPLGLRRTFYDANDVIGERVAVGYRAGRRQRWLRPRAHNGAGGVLSCVADLVAYARHHLGDGSPLMRPETLAESHRTQARAGSLCDEIALPWFVDTWAGHRVVHHGGTTNGYQADLRLVPDLGLAWVMLTNSHHEHQLDRRIREHLLGPDDELAAIDPPNDLDECVGTYEAVLAHIEIEVQDGGLVAFVRDTARWSRDEPEAPQVPTRLAFRDADRVEALDAPFAGHRGEFVRNPDSGAVEWFRWDGRIARRR